MRKTLCITLLSFIANSVSAASSWSLSGSAYESQSASAKMSQIKSQIASNSQSNTWYSAIELAGLFVESMSPTISWVGDTFSDDLLGPRKKYIHTVGNTATAKFVPVSNSAGFTGMFASGCDNVIIRYSIAKKQDTSSAPYDNFTPGIGVKFLRDGMRSANLVAMKSVNGQDSWNPFEYDFANHVPAAEGTALQLVAKKFATATPTVTFVGLSDFSMTDQHGKAVSSPKFPYELIFEPGTSVKGKFPKSYSQDFQSQIGSLSSGTSVYKVYGITEPVNGQKVHIGDIVLTSQFKTSYWGDRYLFFKHQDMQEDLKLRPDWKSHVPVGSSVCPYAFAKSLFSTVFETIYNAVSQTFNLALQ